MSIRAALACAFALAVLPPAAPAFGDITHFGGPGSGPGQFSDPAALILDSAGNLVVSDVGNNRIQKLTPAGEPLLSFTPPGSGPYPIGLAPGSGGDIILARTVQNADSVYRYSSGGVLLDSWGTAPPGDPSRLTSAGAVATDADGNIYVAELSDDRILKFTADGAYLTQWLVRNENGRSLGVGAMAGRANSLAVGAGGRIDVPNELIRYDRSGNVLSQVVPEGGGPITLAENDDAFTVNGAFIWRYDPAGQLLDRFEGIDYTQLGPMSDPCVPVQQPWPWPAAGEQGPQYSGVALDSNGDLYLSDPVNDRITKIDGRPTPHIAWAPGGQAWWNLPVTGQLMTFDASVTEAPFAESVKHEWDLDGDGTFETDTGAVPQASTRYATAGPRTVKVRVTASNGREAVSEVGVNVGESKASFSAGGPSLTGDAVTFDASGSSDACGAITRHEWDLDGDGTFETDTGANPVATRTFRDVGTYRIGLRVTRLGGRVDTITQDHSVRLKPPAGETGVTINDGARFTNSPVVEVNPIWPRFTRSILIANDGGFRNAKSFSIGAAQTWHLDSTGSERLPKTVYVRFDQTGTHTFTDDIILDETDPLLTEATILDQGGAAAAVAKRRSVRLRVRAHDNLSGVARMQVAVNRRHPRHWKRMRRTSRVQAGARRLWVRVRDKAGNRSSWRQAR